MVTQVDVAVDNQTVSESITKEAIDGGAVSFPLSDTQTTVETSSKGVNKATSDIRNSADAFFSNSLGRGFVKPYGYLYRDMDVQIITTPVVSSVNDAPTPAPGNMSLNTGRAIL